jgi:hypothetical protein
LPALPTVHRVARRPLAFGTPLGLGAVVLTLMAGGGRVFVERVDDFDVSGRHVELPVVGLCGSTWVWPWWRRVAAATAPGHSCAAAVTSAAVSREVDPVLRTAAV